MNKNLLKFVTETKNSYLIGKRYYITDYSKLIYSILLILKEEGFVEDFYKKHCPKSNRLKLFIFLRFKQYNDRGVNFSVIKNIKVASKLRDKVFLKNVELSIFDNYKIIILSTTSGVMTHLKAKTLGLGGKVLLSIE